MSYEGDPTRSGSGLLKTLVVVAIIVIAYWASTGGFESIDVPTSTTTPASVTTGDPTATTATVPSPTSTTLLPVGTTIAPGTTIGG